MRPPNRWRPYARRASTSTGTRLWRTAASDTTRPPHIHARYQGHEASFTFDGNLLKGDLPRKQRKLVEAWVLLHAEELEADWELAFNLEHPFRIDPLR